MAWVLGRAGGREEGEMKRSSKIGQRASAARPAGRQSGTACA